MSELPFWGIAAVQLWICTREFSYVQMRLTGDAERDEEQIYYILAEFERNLGCEKRSLVVSEMQAKKDLYTKLRCDELKAQGVKFDPFNTGQPVSSTFQNIPANDWVVLKIHLFPRDFGGRYVASYGNNWWRHVVCPSAVVRELWPRDQTKAPETAQVSQTIPETSPEEQLSIAEPGFAKAHAATKTRSRRSHKQDAVVDALHALFPEGYYSGITASSVLNPITNWLKENRPRVEVSEDTIRNALAKFEAQAKNT
jgi:hypothetical protein